jgi:hypothetical protein
MRRVKVADADMELAFGSNANEFVIARVLEDMKTVVLFLTAIQKAKSKFCVPGVRMPS